MWSCSTGAPAEKSDTGTPPFNRGFDGTCSARAERHLKYAGQAESVLNNLPVCTLSGREILSEVMLLGVLRQPLPDDPKELLTYDWRQLRSRIREAASELEKAWHAEAEAQKLLEAALEGRDAAIQKADRLEAICKQVEHMFPVHYQSCVAAVDEEADDAL